MSLQASLRANIGGLELDAELKVEAGQTVVLVGPNGAGKTTLLRALAGLLPLAAGRIQLDERVLEDVAEGVRVPAMHRSVGFVFQDYLLFPHLSVLENVAFGLRARGTGRTEARRRAQEWLERVDLLSRASDRPGALSSGQQQRVALARALAIEPRLLLLDEPLAALDAGARVEVRNELRKHLLSFQGARIVVTHDPLEAMLLATRMVVLEDGRIVQTGSMEELRERPRSPYVAELVGLNLLRGRAEGDRVVLDSGDEVIVPGAGRGDVFVAIRPRAAALYRDRPHGSPRNVWPATVDLLERDGDIVRVRVRGPVPLLVEVTAAAVGELGLVEGERLWVSVKATEVSVYAA